jgi:putative peptidoglycan lipid II flippase
MTGTRDSGEPGSAAPRGLLRSSAVVGAMTMLSRVLGLARDVVLAAVLGASANADAFLHRLQDSQLSAAPVCRGRLFPGLRARARGAARAGRHGGGAGLIDHVAGVLGVVLRLTALTLLAAPLVAGLFAPGFIGQPTSLS